MAWKFIPGYERIYMVSNNGQVKSLKRRKAQILALCLDTHGYPQVNLYRDKRRKSFLVHQLVLKAFCGAKPPGTECRHLDGNPQNNIISNLQWGTRSENMLDKNIHGTMHDMSGSKNNKAKLNGLQVRVIRKLLYIKEFTQKEIANIFNVTPETICYINTGKTWVK